MTRAAHSSSPSGLHTGILGLRALRIAGVGSLSLFALSCSEGPGVIPYGGAQFTTSSTASAPIDKSCPTFGYTMAIGNPAPTADDPGGTLADGSQGTTVSCRVRGRDEVQFSARIRGRNGSDQKQGELRMTGGTIGSDGTGTVQVSLSTPVSASTATNVQLQSDPETPCTITGVTTSSGNEYGDGILWGRFACSAMVGGVADYCRTEGVVVFENCER